MINLYIDFDGVIMNTIEIGYETIKKNGKEVNSKNCIDFYSNLDWKDFLNNKCSEINNSISCIQKIIDSNLYNVSILSHVTTLNEAVEKIKYIRKYFKDITFIPVPRSISKTEMVHTEGAILIDDYSGNLREWEKEGGIGIRFNLEGENKGFINIDRLDQVIDIDFSKPKNELLNSTKIL